MLPLPPKNPPPLMIKARMFELIGNVHVFFQQLVGSGFPPMTGSENGFLNLVGWEQVHKFSKFIHGSCTLMPDLVQAVPYWVDDESVRTSMLASAPKPPPGPPAYAAASSLFAPRLTLLSH